MGVIARTSNPSGSPAALAYRLIETSMPNMRQDKREKLSELVGRLYTLRIDADYKPSIAVESRDAREAITLMKTIFDSF